VAEAVSETTTQAPRPRIVGPAAAPAAVIAHGSASTADFIVRVFAEPLLAAGYRLVTWDRREAPGLLADQLRLLVAATGARLVGGISVGALAAARVACESPGSLDGLLVVLPPWLGRPDAVADLTRAGADELDAAADLDAVVERVRAAPGWVAREVTDAWRRWADRGALAAELRATAEIAGPTAAELAGCTVPTGVVAITADPLHPADTAARWAGALPRATLRVLDIDGPEGGVDILGRAALDCWASASR
jgi:pimeloyl-ACP methyl ester carboxylesterase